MRVAGHTYAYRDCSLEEALDDLKGVGFDLVEVWLGHVPDGFDGAVRALAQRKLEAAAVSAGGFYVPGDPATVRAFALAEALGAPAVVACMSPAVVRETVSLAPPGITLCLENHWDQPFDRPPAVEAGLQANVSLAACVDTGHAILAGVRPERFVASLGGRIGHVHLKDADLPSPVVRALGRRLRRRFLARPHPAFPGSGALSVSGVLSALAAVSYDGVVSLEHEGADPGRALRELLGRWRQAEQGAGGA